MNSPFFSKLLSNPRIERVVSSVGMCQGDILNKGNNLRAKFADFNEHKQNGQIFGAFGRVKKAHFQATFSTKFEWILALNQGAKIGEFTLIKQQV